MRRNVAPIHLGAALLVATVAAIAGASEPTKTPTPNTGSEKTLSDVAGGIELNKKAAGDQESIVINNENLATLAGKGRITEVTKTGPKQTGRGLADVTGTGAGVEGEDAGYVETQEKKQYWQAIYGQQLSLIEDIRKQIDILDYNIPGLWRDFYSWDDPAYRDGVIKPKLDEALAQRQKLEVDIQKSESKLDQIVADSRKDGGQPGWFRGFKKPPTPKPTEGIMPR
jgi:hypothetical protein